MEVVSYCKVAGSHCKNTQIKLFQHLWSQYPKDRALYQSKEQDVKKCDI